MDDVVKDGFLPLLDKAGAKMKDPGVDGALTQIALHFRCTIVRKYPVWTFWWSARTGRVCRLIGDDG